MDFETLEDFSDTATLTGGSFYYVGTDSEPGVYYCIDEGVIGQHTRIDEVPATTSKWRITGARFGEDCLGGPVPIDLRGCLRRQEPVAP